MHTLLWVEDSSLPNHFLIKKSPNTGHQERSPKLTARSRFQRDTHHLLPANMAKKNLISFCKLCKFSYFVLILLLQFIFSEMFQVWQKRERNYIHERMDMRRNTTKEASAASISSAAKLFNLVLSFMSPLHGEQMESHSSIWWHHKSVNLSLTEVLEARNQLII